MAKIIRAVLTLVITIGIIKYSESIQIKRQTNLDELNKQLLDGILNIKVFYINT